MTRAIIWGYTHGSLWAEDTDDWVRAFYAYDQSDNCALAGVEVDGAYLEAKTVRDLPEYEALDRADSDRYKAAVAEAKNNVVVEVKHPIEDRWAHVDSLPSEAAQQRLTELVERYGPNRVRLRRPR